MSEVSLNPGMADRSGPESFRVWLDAPLRQLLLMQSRGKVRQTWKKLMSPRRAIPTMIVGAMMVLYVIQIYIALALNTSTTRVPVESIAPIGLFSILCMKLLGVCIDREKSGAGFRHEEIHTLLGGPFSHQQVRLYRVCGHAVSIFFTSVFAAIFFGLHVKSLIASLSGAYLAMMFTYLIYSTIAVVAVNVPDRTYKWVRNVCVAVALGTLAYVLYRVSLLEVRNLAFLKAIGDEAIVLSNSAVGSVLLSPFSIFTNVIVAETPSQWAFWMVPALLLNYGSLQLLMRLEVAFDKWSQQRERKDFVANRNSLVYLDSRYQKLKEHLFDKSVPWVGGSGPIVWRQLKGLSRLKGGLGWLLIPLGMAFAVGGYVAYDPEAGATQTIAVIVVLTSVFLPGLLPFDFRGDLKGLAALKMMPLQPLSVVLGQLVVPVVLLTGFQFLALSSLVLHDSTLVPSLLITICFLVPTNTIIIALENLIFLMYPYRVAEFDAQATVRRIVMLMAKFCVVFLAVLVSLLAGLGVLGLKMAVQSNAWLAETFMTLRWPLLITTQLTALWAATSIVVWTTCWAYRRFDLSEDLPA